MEKSVVADKAIEAARAVNTLLCLSSRDNEALLEVTQDCFFLPEDNPVDDSESRLTVMESGELQMIWKVRTQ